MPQKTLNLFHIPFEDLFRQLKAQFPAWEYDFKKHGVVFFDESKVILGQVRLPLHLSIDNELKIINENALVLYLSIESGSAAICIMHGKQNVYHTTFSAYMTRKKQGFSQIKYLNKKGKSRAGSRVRLASTVEFFENINNTLTDLIATYDFDRIALNCNTTLIPYLFQTKVTCPFEKKDARLYKIPLHIPQSNYTNLDAAIKKLMAPILICDENSLLGSEGFIQNQMG